MVATIIGPAAPENSTAQDSRVFAGFETMRNACIELAKRAGRGVETAKRFPDPDKVRPAATADANEDHREIDAFSEVIIPPFDFRVLCQLYENSGALRRNIDAMVQNIDGFGHQFTPVLNFASPNIGGTIRDLTLRHRVDDQEVVDLFDLDLKALKALEPTDEEVEETREFWERVAKIEKGRLDTYFESINTKESFTEVRKETREALEITGNAAWEIIREDPEEPLSSILQINFVSFVGLRLTRLDKIAVEVIVPVRRDPVHFGEMKVMRHFRRFVRRTSTKKATFYKEFGDPRILSQGSGKFYESIDELEEKEGEKARPATELVHWRIKSQLSSYGVPRWIGSLLAVLGSRAAEEVNFLYFDNKAIPPMIMLVSGGRLTSTSVEKIESYVENQIKGRKNFHSIMVLEALPADAKTSEGKIEHSGKLRFELKPLIDAQLSDGQFQNYDDSNEIKIGRSFRQSPIVTGDTRDMNRSTAQTAKAMGEEQIYQPPRDAFDAWVNCNILTVLKVHFWRFQTRAPVTRIPSELVENVTKSTREGLITPNEARPLLGDAFSVDFPHIDEEWANTPTKLAQAAIKSGSIPGATGEEESSEGIEKALKGSTTQENGHDHKFSVSVKNGIAVVTVEDHGDHTHEVDEVVVEGGQNYTVTTKPTNDHSHSLTFAIQKPPKPKKKTKKRQGRLVNLALALQQAVEGEMDSAMDEFFDPSASEQADESE